MKKKILGLLVAGVLAASTLTGCGTEAERVSYNLSQQADNFNVVRQLTVINCIEGDVLFQMTGKMSITADTADNQLEIIDNHSAFGRARVALASFKTYQEAQNFFKYAQTYIVRFMFLMTDEALTSLGKRVPDLMDYSDANIFS